jgi:hypothetical protein
MMASAASQYEIIRGQSSILTGAMESMMPQASRNANIDRLLYGIGGPAPNVRSSEPLGSLFGGIIPLPNPANDTQIDYLVGTIPSLPAEAGMPLRRNSLGMCSISCGSLGRSADGDLNSRAVPLVQALSSRQGFDGHVQTHSQLSQNRRDGAFRLQVSLLGLSTRFGLPLSGGEPSSRLTCSYKRRIGFVPDAGAVSDQGERQPPRRDSMLGSMHSIMSRSLAKYDVGPASMGAFNGYSSDSECDDDDTASMACDEVSDVRTNSQIRGQTVAADAGKQGMSRAESSGVPGFEASFSAKPLIADLQWNGCNIDYVQVILNKFRVSMERSQKSQQDIHDWDRKMGLKRSHSKTMRLTTRSRKKLRATFCAGVSNPELSRQQISAMPKAA